MFLMTQGKPDKHTVVKISDQKKVTLGRCFSEDEKSLTSLTLDCPGGWEVVEPGLALHQIVVALCFTLDYILLLLEKCLGCK